MENNIFHIEWDTGFVDVDVSTFFVEANVSKLKKLYKLARQYSTEEERLTLLDALSQEDKKRKELLDALNDLSRKKAELARSLYPVAPAQVQGWAEKQLVKDRTRLAKAIELLKEEEWF